MNAEPNLAPLLEGFFTQRLIAQRRASPHTIAAYRDTFRLLLGFVQKRSGRAPSKLTLADLNAPLIASFLDELESQRTNNPRSRNLRLSASVRSSATPRWKRPNIPRSFSACWPFHANGTPFLSSTS